MPIRPLTPRRQRFAPVPASRSPIGDGGFRVHTVSTTPASLIHCSAVPRWLVEPNDSLAPPGQVRDDKPDVGGQFALVPFDLGHNTTLAVPTGSPVHDIVIACHRLLRRTAHGEGTSASQRASVLIMLPACCPTAPDQVLHLRQFDLCGKARVIRIRSASVRSTDFEVTE